MNSSRFEERNCPSCDCSPSASSIVVRGERCAEELTLEELLPYWAGLFKEKVFFSYVRCARCGLLYAPHFFSDAQLTELYRKMAPNMELVADEAVSATQHTYFDAAIVHAADQGSYIELGPDTGQIVERAVADGRFNHYWLFEPNREVHSALATAAGSAPYTISEQMDDLSEVPDRSVALAVLVHVVDHLLDPVQTMKQVHAKLIDGGAVAIVTHNEASLLRKMMRTRWPPFCLQHPQIFSTRSIREMVKRIGFDDIAVQRTINYFPIDFMARQAAWTVRIDLERLRMPKTIIGLKLGNIMTIARR